MAAVAKVLVAGLGNREYALTKHSLGQYIVEGLAQRLGAGRLKAHPAVKGEGVLANTTLPGHTSPLVLYISTRQMNISGPAIANAARKLSARPLLLIYDSVGDAPCTLAVKHGGGARGHNGVRSVQAHHPAGAAFWHLRAGVGRPAGGSTGLADFVLSKLSAEERAFWGHQGAGMDLVVQALDTILSDIEGKGSA